jgi:hypothetical protein
MDRQAGEPPFNSSCGRARVRLLRDGFAATAGTGALVWALAGDKEGRWTTPGSRMMMLSEKAPLRLAVIGWKGEDFFSAHPIHQPVSLPPVPQAMPSYASLSGLGRGWLLRVRGTAPP